MFAMGIIAFGTLLLMAIFGLVGLVFWGFALLSFFRIFPRDPSRPHQIIAGIYFVLFGAAMSFVLYQFSEIVGFIFAAAVIVALFAGLYRRKTRVASLD